MRKSLILACVALMVLAACGGGGGSSGSIDGGGGGGNTPALAECLQFADGSSFGPIAYADVTFPSSGKTIAHVSVQVIGAPSYTVPSDCPGTAENTITAFGANGILGVGPFAQDCGPACASTTSFPTGWYYNCSTPTNCVATSATLAQQLQNPVTLFSSDNNGVILELPSPPVNGTSSLSGGALVFGIGTQGNNGLGSATVLLADTSLGFVQASFNGSVGLNAALDSGSNANFFTDSAIPACPTAVGFYCPNAPVNLTAVLQAASGSATAAADFTVANLEDLFNANNSAAVLPNVGGPVSVPAGTQNAIQFDLGMPFFFGVNVYTAIENAATPGGTGPYFAYQPSATPPQTIAAPGPPNVEPVILDAGPPSTNAFNTSFVTITVCVPGTQTCQTIDHVEVDTGSSGLRILHTNAGGELNLSLPPAAP